MTPRPAGIPPINTIPRRAHVRPLAVGIQSIGYPAQRVPPYPTSRVARPVVSPELSARIHHVRYILWGPPISGGRPICRILRPVGRWPLADGRPFGRIIRPSRPDTINGMRPFHRVRRPRGTSLFAAGRRGYMISRPAVILPLSAGIHSVAQTAWRV